MQPLPLGSMQPTTGVSKPPSSPSHVAAARGGVPTDAAPPAPAPPWDQRENASPKEGLEPAGGLHGLGEEVREMMVVRKATDPIALGRDIDERPAFDPSCPSRGDRTSSWRLSSRSLELSTPTSSRDRAKSVYRRALSPPAVSLRSVGPSSSTSCWTRPSGWRCSRSRPNARSRDGS